MPEGASTTAERNQPVHRSVELSASQLERLQALIGDRIWLVVGLAASSIVAGLCEAGILATTAQSASALVSGKEIINKSLGPLHLHTSVRDVLIVGIGFAVVRLLLQVPISWLPAVIAGDVQATMRRRLIRSYLFSSWEVQSQDREGHFQEMMTNQIMQASAGALQATQFVTSLVTFLILILSAFALNTIEALVVLVAATALFAILRPVRTLGRNLAKRLSAAQLEYAGSVGETNRVAEETSVFGTADAQVEGVESFIATARYLYMRAQLIVRLVPNVYQSLIYFVLVFGLLGASLANVKGFSALGAIVLLLIRAGTYGQQVQNTLVSLRQTLPYVERLQSLSTAYAARIPKRGTIPLGEIHTISFDDVEYEYNPERPVLKGISFTVLGGETIGVVGPSGAGKSTMVQMLLRLREPQRGHYRINGTDAADLDFDDWHQCVAYVPQAPKLLHASVTDNVRFFRDYDDAAVERACKLARIHDEIMSWPKGYQTIVGPRADAVSGGQQQRICLARALVSSPNLLVLDEPTSALDPRSEQLIQDSLESLQSELTLFIIAHRMSTLTICDRVMVVLDGNLDAFAALDDLTATNHYYRFASGLPPLPDEVTDENNGVPSGELAASAAGNVGTLALQEVVEPATMPPPVGSDVTSATHGTQDPVLVAKPMELRSPFRVQPMTPVPQPMTPVTQPRSWLRRLRRPWAIRRRRHTR